MENNEFVEKKKNKKLIVIIVIVLLIAILGVGSYLFIRTKIDPSSYLSKLSNDITSYIDNYFNSFQTLNKNFTGDEFKLTGNMQFTTDATDLEVLNSYSIDYDFLGSIKQEELQMSLDLLEDENSLLNGTFYLNNEALYLEVSDLYEKILRISELDENIFALNSDISYSSKDVINSINNFIKYYFEALKLSDFSSQIEGLYTVRFNFSITDNNIENVTNKFNELVESDKILKNLLEGNEDNFSINFAPVDMEILVNIFTGEIYEFKSDNGVNSLEITKDENEDNKYLIKDGNDTHQLLIQENGITLSLYDEELLTYTLALTTSDKNFTFNLTDASNDLELVIRETNDSTLNMAFNYENKEDDIGLDLNATINYTSNGYKMEMLEDIIVEGEKIGCTITGEYIAGDNLLEKTDLSDYKDIETLTDTELNTIKEKLMEKLANAKFLELLAGNSSL